MKLTDLNPKWCSHGGDGVSRLVDGVHVPIPERKRIGLLYDCPCGCGDRRYVPFANPADGQGPLQIDKPMWTRKGQNFEFLTLTPSIQHVAVDPDDCNWHGFITNGEVRTA